ncbi:MAG: response regulator transcription factor [Anaerolineales bacterium]|nr:response regulator transcription factor [Anaerolineales bacterium]
MKALIVDGDLALADVLAFTLRRAGFEVISAHDGLTALQRWESEDPDLLILDLNLPKLDGLNVCKRIRASSDVPIIILSVRSEEDDIVRSLQSGADDYIIKPFSPRQLVARAEAVLRRASKGPQSAAPLSAGDLSFDPTRGEVSLAGAVIAQLTRLECQLLETLLINRGQVLRYDTLIYHVWGPGGGDRAMLKQLVYRLRRKLERRLPQENPLIETVPNIGYALKL